MEEIYEIHKSERRRLKFTLIVSPTIILFIGVMMYVYDGGIRGKVWLIIGISSFIILYLGMFIISKKNRNKIIKIPIYSNTENPPFDPSDIHIPAYICLSFVSLFKGISLMYSDGNLLLLPLLLGIFGFVVVWVGVFQAIHKRRKIKKIFNKLKKDKTEKESVKFRW